MDGPVGEVTGVGVFHDPPVLPGERGENARRLLRVAPLEITEKHVAERSVTEFLLPARHLLRPPHRLVIPLGELSVFAQVVERGGVRKPLDGVHPHGVAAEIRPPADAVAGEVRIVGMAELRVVDVLAVAVEPVFRRAVRLRHPAEDTRIAHLAVAERKSEQIEPAPALHRLGGGLLAVAVTVPDSAGEGMSRPRVERAEERESPLVTPPVRVVARDEPQHRAELLPEVRVHEAEKRTRIGEVAVVEVVVVEGFGVVARRFADESAPARHIGEVESFLSGRPREPVLELRPQAVVRLLEGRRVARLARRHHRKGHLQQTFAAPVGVATEIAALGVVIEESPEKHGIVGGVGEVVSLRGGPMREHAGEGVDD